MPRDQPHSLALFSLIPINDRAYAVLDHLDNQHLVSALPDHNGLLGLDIGFHIGTTSRSTLATLGRSGADVIVEGSSISRIHCSFEVSEEFGSIMLYDRSNSQTTQVFGDNAIPFEPGRIRRIVVADGINTAFGMGGVGSNLVQFRLVWHHRRLNVFEEVNRRVDNPRQARTVDEAPTIPPSRRLTRIHTPSDRASLIRYASINELGRGQFGEVHKAVDVDSGRLMAVKMIKRPVLGFTDQTWLLLMREVQTLAQVSHPCIVEYISTQSQVDQLEIFMALKDGNLESLIKQNYFKNEHSRAEPLLRHILQALDYLAFHRIVHRDIKPANILFAVADETDYRFLLTDFGLCNVVDDAKTYAGSPMFMAPEVLRSKGTLQTAKVDVWSLFVTLAYAMDVEEYQKKPMRTDEQKIEAALAAARTPVLTSIRAMAVVDPNKRASAAEMLRQCFGGAGMTTPLEQIGYDPPTRNKSRPKVRGEQKSNAVGPVRGWPPPPLVDARVVKRRSKSTGTARACAGISTGRAASSALPQGPTEQFPVPGTFPVEP